MNILRLGPCAAIVGALVGAPARAQTPPAQPVLAADVAAQVVIAAPSPQAIVAGAAVVLPPAPVIVLVPTTQMDPMPIPTPVAISVFTIPPALAGQGVFRPPVGLPTGAFGTAIPGAEALVPPPVVQPNIVRPASPIATLPSPQGAMAAITVAPIATPIASLTAVGISTAPAPSTVSAVPIWPPPWPPGDGVRIIPPALQMTSRW